MAERTSHGHWLPGRSANPGGRPGVPEVVKHPTARTVATRRRSSRPVAG